MIEVINADEFKTKIFDFEANEEWKFAGTSPVILNFTASWCGPCRAFAPILEQIATEYKDKVQVLKVDIDASPELSDLFGIRSVPTTLFISPSKAPAMASGLLPKEQVKKAILEVMGV